MHEILSRAIRTRKQQSCLGVIAEIKRRRAGGPDLLGGRSPAEIARTYRSCGATALSVVTSAWFGGNLNMLEEVASADLGLPILRKDLISTERDLQVSKSTGASAVLLVLPLLGIERLQAMLAAARDTGLEPFVEVASRDEIEQVRKIYDGVLAINNSDIKTNETEGDDISRSVGLIDRADPRLWISASRIQGPQDVHAVAVAGFDGILIGTHLLEADDLRTETNRIIAAARRYGPLPMTRPVVKICGVTTAEEIEHLTAAHVDFFGLVVDVPSPWAIDPERATALAALAGGRTRATLITKPGQPEQLARRIQEIGVTAIQLAPITPPEFVAELRRRFPREALTILQECSYRRGQFWKEEQIGDYLAAGADFILIDKLKSADSGGGPSGTAIPRDELVAFRHRHPGQPLLVAGGIDADNAAAWMAASGAMGIDVCSSVRRGGPIESDLLRGLMERIEQVSVSENPLATF